MVKRNGQSFQSIIYRLGFSRRFPEWLEVSGYLFQTQSLNIQNQPPEMFCQKKVFLKSSNFLGKHLKAWSPATLFKRDSNTSVFLWLLWNFWEHLFWRGSVNDYSQYSYTAQKTKFSMKDFLSKCDWIRSFLRIWSHLRKKSLMENSILCAVL